MTDSRWLRRMLGFGLLGMAAMTVVVPVFALIRNTTAHDWYAARKVTVVDVMIEVGFDRFAPAEYRTADGATRTVTRYDIFFNGEALSARKRILDSIADNAILGAGSGFGGVILFLAGCWSAGRSRRGRAETPAARAPRAPAAWAVPEPGAVAPATDAGRITRPAGAAPAAQADRAPAVSVQAPDVAPAAPAAAGDGGRDDGARSPARAARRRPRRYGRWT